MNLGFDYNLSILKKHDNICKISCFFLKPSPCRFNMILILMIKCDINCILKP